MLAVLTNSWKGSALIHHVVEALGLTPRSEPAARRARPVEGRYALDSVEAVVGRRSVTESETDPLTGVQLRRKYPLSLDAPLMSWRSDFPRPGVARIGWIALPHAVA